MNIIAIYGNRSSGYSFLAQCANGDVLGGGPDRGMIYADLSVMIFAAVDAMLARGASGKAMLSQDIVRGGIEYACSAEIELSEPPYAGEIVWKEEAMPC